MSKETILEHHTLHGKFILSSGVKSETYIDLRSALLCDECHFELMEWYEGRIGALYQDYEGEPISVVVTGIFGAIFAGDLFENIFFEPIVWNPKDHGVIWSGDKDQINKTKQVVLVDDVKTSGNTLRNLREACEGRGWEVIGEIVYVENSSR